MTDRVHGIRLRWLLLLVCLAATAMALTVESHLGSRLHRPQTEALPRDTVGRPLYILLVDSMSWSDFDQLTALTKLSETAFTADIQPCVDNFTSACVREAMTGRPSFSLFAALENFQVIKKKVGENLIDDANGAGLQTAFISHGDLRAWSKRAHDDIRPDEDDHTDELALGLEAAQSHDLVFHHWIWHDVSTHHNRPGTQRYQQSLARTDRLIAGLIAGLPEGTDFIVMGDHGHENDGRHVQGMDTPTRVVVRSPNIKPIHLKERIPITAIRYLAAGVTGLGSPSAQRLPEWEDWIATPVSDGIRFTGGVPTHATPGFPWSPLAATVGLAFVAALGFGWRPALLVFAFAIGLGLSFPVWLEMTQQKMPLGKIHQWLWVAPVCGGVLGLGLKRNFADAYRWTLFGGLGLCLVLWPGLGLTSVLRGLEAIVFPVFIGAAALSFIDLVPASTRARRGLVIRCFWVTALAIASTFGLDEVSAFSTNDLRIRRYPFQNLRINYIDWMPAVKALLGTGVYYCVHRHIGWASIAGGLVLLSPHLPPLAHALGMLGLVGLLAYGRGRLRSRAVVLTALALSGYVLTSRRQLGALAVALTMGVGLMALGRLGRGPASAARDRALVWAVAITLVTTAYLGLAWTMELRVHGVDFSFAVHWLEGRWHKRLWWMVGLATTVAIMLPLVLVQAVARREWPNRFAQIVDLAARIAVLRFAFTVVFATAWMIAAGENAASSRLRATLQDGLAWLLIALALGLLMGRHQTKTNSLTLQKQ